MMMKFFVIEAQAERFAQEVHAKVTIQYDWDDMRQAIVKIYVVKF